MELQIADDIALACISPDGSQVKIDAYVAGLSILQDEIDVQNAMVLLLRANRFILLWDNAVLEVVDSRLELAARCFGVHLLRI